MSGEFQRATNCTRWMRVRRRWPTCGLSITEAERSLPGIIDQLEVELKTARPGVLVGRQGSGIEELRKQTVSVLSFKKLDTTVFDTQLAFNLLARYGEEALEPLEGIEQRIVRDTTTLLAAWAELPMPSIRLVQAPVFHGHSISLWVEFVSNVDTRQLRRILTAADIDDAEDSGRDMIERARGADEGEARLLIA